MAIKRKGVVAVPGEYKYGDLVEIKIAEELKDAAERYPMVPLTMGHPSFILPKASESIGVLKQKWNAVKQRVDGEFWFHEDKISEDLMRRLKTEAIPISAGILLDDVDADGTQHGMVWGHMAVLDGENPVCPLSTCGINIRMESMPDKLIRYEQATNLEVPEEPKVAPEEVKVPDVVVEPEAEIPKTEEPAVVNIEEEVVEPIEEEVKLVPEVIIPVGETVSKKWKVGPDGWISFTLS